MMTPLRTHAGPLQDDPPRNPPAHIQHRVAFLLETICMFLDIHAAWRRAAQDLLRWILRVHASYNRSQAKHAGTVRRSSTVSVAQAGP